MAKDNELVFRECGEGWKRLIDPVVELVNATDGRIEQIKEKFGTLRIYYYPGPNDLDGEIDKLISQKEHESINVCEICGAAGKLRNKNGWVKTLCDDDTTNLGYKEIT